MGFELKFPTPGVFQSQFPAHMGMGVGSKPLYRLDCKASYLKRILEFLKNVQNEFFIAQATKVSILLNEIFIITYY